MRTHLTQLSCAALVAAVVATAVPAQGQAVNVDAETFAGLDIRAIGPATMSGRISAVDAVAWVDCSKSMPASTATHISGARIVEILLRMGTIG